MGECDSIKDKVREFILTEFLTDDDKSALTNETPLISGGILDSIGVVKLVSYLETTYSIVLASIDITIDRFNTIDAIANTMYDKVNRE